MTSDDVWYLDTSAAVKLVFPERESKPLRSWARGVQLVSSDLLRTELVRTAQQWDEERRRQAGEFLDRITLIRLDVPAFERAGRLGPRSLRSLDALHLAAAESLGPDLAGIVTYDQRLADAAREIGMVVAAPS